MAKSKGLRNELGMIKLPYADHFSRRISSVCKLATVVKAIEKNLTKRQLHLFKDDIFGYFLECQNFPFSSVILHNVLLR